MKDENGYYCHAGVPMYRDGASQGGGAILALEHSPSALRFFVATLIQNDRPAIFGAKYGFQAWVNFTLALLSRRRRSCLLMADYGFEELAPPLNLAKCMFPHQVGKTFIFGW